MADLRTLLHESAPKPTSPLDLDAVHARAQHRPRRRLATWLSIAGLTLGIGIPGGSVLVTADRANNEQTAPPTVSTVVAPAGVDDAIEAATTTSISPPSGVASRRSAPTGIVHSTGASGPSGPDDGAREDAPPTTLRSATPPPTTGASPSPSPSDYPQGASCSVNNEGLGPSEQRRCRFTATADGGARHSGTGDEVSGPHGQVFVTRDGTTTVRPVTGVSFFAGDWSRGCAERFIQPGDLVELVLTNGGSGTQEVATIGAGAGWECPSHLQDR